MKKFIFLCELLPQNKIVGRPWFLADSLKKKGYKVYYFALSPIFYRYWQEKKNVSQKFFDILKITHYQISGIEVYAIPIYLPRRYLLFHYLNFQLLFPNLIINKFKEIFQDSIIFVNNLLWFWTLERVKNYNQIIYDRADDLKVFYPYEKIRNYYEKLENRLLKKVNVTLAINEKIKKELEAKNPFLKVLKVPNGVPEEWSFLSFHQLPTLPGINRNIKKPIIGFIGAIYWWVDLDLIETCIKNFSEATFIFIGPYKNNIKRFSKYPNFLLLGPQPYSLIPYYINLFDVCLIPFKKSEVSYGADPVKLYEYLAFGKPIISTIEWQSDFYLNKLIYLANSEKEFIEKIKIALKEKDENLFQERKKYVLENHTWRKRAETLLKSI